MASTVQHFCYSMPPSSSLLLTALFINTAFCLACSGDTCPLFVSVCSSAVLLARPLLLLPRFPHLCRCHQQYEDFNETDAGKPAFLRVLPPLTLANSTYMNHYYRPRLRSLKAVDELVGSLVAGACGCSNFVA